MVLVVPMGKCVVENVICSRRVAEDKLALLKEDLTKIGFFEWTQ